MFEPNELDAISIAIRIVCLVFLGYWLYRFYKADQLKIREQEKELLQENSLLPMSDKPTPHTHEKTNMNTKK